MTADKYDTATVWFDHSKCDNCQVRLGEINQNNWLIIGRPSNRDYVIEITTICSTMQDSNVPRILRVYTERSRYSLEFLTEEIAANYMKEIAHLKIHGKNAKNQSVKPEKYFEESTQNHQSKAKDALAWTILHGGWLAAKTALTTGAVAAGLMDKSAARQLTRMLAKMGPHYKRKAWEHYEKTGNIWEMVQIAAGSTEYY